MSVPLTWWVWSASTLCGLGAVAWGLRAWGSRRWAAGICALTRQLESARVAVRSREAAPLRFEPGELDDLPAPVRRYLRTVLKPGQPIVSAVTIEMTGSLNLSATAERWKPFSSRQRVVTCRPGFLWDACVSLVPGVAVRVVDSCIAGRGLMRAAVLGVLSVAEVDGEGEIARGEFMRFCAEAAWYPTALLPRQGVHWEAVDAHSARACMRDGALSATLTFGFGEDGLIHSVQAAARGAMVDGKVVMLPWDCRFSNYQKRDEMTVPLAGEAAWVHPEGRRPYFRGTITSLAVEFESC